MSKERLMQWIALAANAGTIVGLLMVLMQLQQNRTLMRAQVRHELAATSAYTAVVAGKDDTTGVGLVEVYRTP